MSVKTRSQSSSHLSDYVGSGRILLASELPTSRDLLRLGILLRGQSSDDHELPVSKLCQDILPILLGSWSKANALFKYPVIKHERTVLRRIENIWKSALLVARGKGKSSEVKNLEDKLDKLFDILNCECPFWECQSCACDGCEVGVHVSCACSRDKKKSSARAGLHQGSEGESGKQV